MILPQGENLVFLISQPRAGSTLLQLMLSGHGDIATTSEPWIALHSIFALRRGSDITTTYEASLAREALYDFLEQSGMDERDYKGHIASFLTSLYNIPARRQSSKIFLDKTPRYYQIIPELLEIFPKAKLVILIRNPMAVLHSILTTWIKEDFSQLSNYRDDLVRAPQNLVDSVKQYPARCFRVKYEELVTKPETVLREICQFLNISYSDNMLDYGDRRISGWKFGDPVGIQKASRPNTKSVNAWKKGFASPQEGLFALSYLKDLGPDLIGEMGYNYNEIAASIEVAPETSRSNLFSWSTVLGDISGLSKSRLTNMTNLLIVERNKLRSERKELCTERNRAMAERDRLREGLERLKNERDELRTDRNRLRTEKNKLGIEMNRFKIEKKTEVDRLRKERNSLKMEIDKLFDSVSWKITAPVRLIMNVLKRH